MCVIAVKPVGAKMPDEAYRKSMFTYNDDGAGFSYTLNKRVYIEKGFLSLKEFENAIAGLEKRLKTIGKTVEDIPLMMHFRIGTHGPNSGGLTHPFPISNKFEHLSSVEMYSDIAVAHNGIIHSVTAPTDWSDTQAYIADVLVPLKQAVSDFYMNKHFQDLIENTINGSRFAFLDKYGNFSLIGDWKESKEPGLEGLKFSNLLHENYSYGYTRYYSSGKKGGWYYGYDDDDDYDYFGKSSTEETMVMASPIPVGYYLCASKNLDPQFRIKNMKTVIPMTASLYKSYWVDTVGDVYHSAAFGNSKLIPSAVYDYAVELLEIEEDGKKVMYAVPVTCDSPDTKMEKPKLVAYSERVIPSGGTKK